MRKGRDCDEYDKRNITVVILTHIFRNGQKSHDGDHTTF